VYVGAEIPDFSFQDFDGAPRKLSDFKGKYVLLDFWGSWCTPCKVEMPYLKAAYARFKSRGFEILGMDKDEDPAKAKLFVNENQMDWPQATTESIIDLIRFRFRISGWPSKILIDPQQRVVMVDAKGQLNGDKLADALDKLLPRN
jgi:thiol-disulfide isomerase/thioredoxin